jgi:N-acetyl-gamma-glutamyl-phosphate reductase
MKRVGIYGASGYTGVELLRILLGHPEVEITCLHSRSFAGSSIEEVFGSFRGLTELRCEDSRIEECASRCDVLFLALPHGIASHAVTDELLRETLIIDLGADFRLRDRRVYEQWYGVAHGNPSLLPKAQYGLCELYRREIASADLIANPGCYTTASISALAPLLMEHLVDPASLIVDAKSGVSGAGRSPSPKLHFAEANESIKAYKVEGHRHTPEIEQALSDLSSQQIVIRFTPHLVPMNRGILVSAYGKPKRRVFNDELQALYRRYYGDEPFIRLLEPGKFPESRWVRGSNYIDISVHYDERSDTVLVLSALDNLVKGAAGQAVQNMNIRLGFDETEGLLYLPMFP